MALRLVRLLRRGLYRPDLGLPTIYSNPTVAQLSEALSAQREEAQDGDHLLIEPVLSTFRALIEQIEKPEPRPVERQNNLGNDPVTAVLTGSTGTIGTFLLRALLDKPGIDHVYCLNRSKDGGNAVQKIRMAERGLEIAGLGPESHIPPSRFQPAAPRPGRKYV